MKTAKSLGEMSFSDRLLGDTSSLITPHLLYQRLGNTETERQITYRELFHDQLDSTEIDQIRKTTN